MTGSILPVAAGLASLAFSFYALVPLAIRRTMTMDLRKISLRPPMYLIETDPETGEAAPPGQRGAIFEYFFAEDAPRIAAKTRLPIDTGDTEEINASDLF